MNDIKTLENQIKDYCSEHMDKDDFIGIKHITLQDYDENNRKATFIAKDISTAVFVNTRCSQELVQALESIVGESAFVDCQYKTYSKPVHERFTRITQECEDIKPISNLPSSLDPAEELIGGKLIE